MFLYREILYITKQVTLEFVNAIFFNAFSWKEVNPRLDYHTKHHTLKSQYYDGWMRNWFAYNIGSFEPQSKRAKQKQPQVILSYWPLFFSSLYIFHLSLLIIFLLQMCVFFSPRSVTMCVDFFLWGTMCINYRNFLPLILIFGGFVLLITKIQSHEKGSTSGITKVNVWQIFAEIGKGVLLMSVIISSTKGDAIMNDKSESKLKKSLLQRKMWDRNRNNKRALAFAEFERK